MKLEFMSKVSGYLWSVEIVYRRNYIRFSLFGLIGSVIWGTQNKLEMSTIINSLLVVVIVAMIAGCERNVDIGDPCARGKLIQQWCPDSTNLSIIQILSDPKIGADWSRGGHSYKDIVLAVVEDSLLDNSVWSDLPGSTDSTFNFRYEVMAQQNFLMCYVCCPPSKTILIKSVSRSPCPYVE